MRSITADVSRMPDGSLSLTYSIEGDLDGLRIPAPRPPRIAERLWEHTCCEIFASREGTPAYHEFNFSPSGEWAAYAFERYRKGSPLLDEALDPHVMVRRGAGKLELDALIRLDGLSPMYATGSLTLALSAVIEDSDGALSYWALAHPPGNPDFHHRDGFTLVSKASCSNRHG